MPDYNRYTYPDVMVVAGEPVFVDQKQMEVTNPCLIVEILSSSTQAYDHDSEFRQYRSILSFQEYILVYQNSYEVDHYVKESMDRSAILIMKPILVFPAPEALETPKSVF